MIGSTQTSHIDNINSFLAMEIFSRAQELEAQGREIGLFVQWAEKNKLGHLKWTQSSK